MCSYACTRCGPATSTGIPWQKFATAQPGASLAWFVCRIQRYLQQRLLSALTEIQLRSVVTTRGPSDGNALEAIQPAVAAVNCPLRPQVILAMHSASWLPPARALTWRRGTLGPLPQQQPAVQCPWAGLFPRHRLLPPPLQSLTDDDDDRPLPLPAARPPVHPWVLQHPSRGLHAAQAETPATHPLSPAAPPPMSLPPPGRAGSLQRAGRHAGSIFCASFGVQIHGSVSSTTTREPHVQVPPARGCSNSTHLVSSRGGDGGGSNGGAGNGQRSPEHVVSEHVGWQRSASAGQLDPVGARDSSQQPGASTQVAAAVAITHGSLPPLDALRPPPGDSWEGQPGDARSSWGADSATEDDSGGMGGGYGGSRAAGPSWVGQSVWAVPCSTVGYGTRAEVLARLPASIMLLRHAECMTLDELQAHERVPNHDIPLSEAGVAQARLLGQRLRPALTATGMHLFIYTSPFLRCSETTKLLADELAEGSLVSGVREAVQLREQDWGNFQDPRVQAECKAERLRYGRFYYRFPSGESVADVYDRLTIFQDHLVRDMCAGRFAESTCLTIVSHGLTLRAFVMRWLHWTVRQFLQVYNIPNAEPVLLHKDVQPSYLAGDNANLPFLPHHTKCLYRLTPRALELMRGADCSMATSSGCWHRKELDRAPPGAPHIRDEEEQLWADVDGMV